MDKIDKFLKSLPPKQRKAIEELVIRIITNDFKGLDCRRLRASSRIYRVRKGNIRIIFQKISGEKNIIIIIERRKEDTYKFL